MRMRGASRAAFGSAGEGSAPSQPLSWLWRQQKRPADDVFCQLLPAAAGRRTEAARLFETIFTLPLCQASAICRQGHPKTQQLRQHAAAPMLRTTKAPPCGFKRLSAWTDPLNLRPPAVPGIQAACRKNRHVQQRISYRPWHRRFAQTADGKACPAQPSSAGAGQEKRPSVWVELTVLSLLPAFFTFLTGWPSWLAFPDRPWHRHVSHPASKEESGCRQDGPSATSRQRPAALPPTDAGCRKDVKKKDRQPGGES